MRVQVQKVLPGAQLPTYATDGSACFDLYSIEEGLIHPSCSGAFNTGLVFEVPEGWAMKVYSRSGHGFKNGIRLANTVGVIDSDFRGPVAIKLHNDGHVPFHVKPGDRIAQAMLERVEQIEFFENFEGLTATARGAGGFGSTGT